MPIAAQEPETAWLVSEGTLLDMKLGTYRVYLRAAAFDRLDEIERSAVMNDRVFVVMRFPATDNPEFARSVCCVQQRDAGAIEDAVPS